MAPETHEYSLKNELLENVEKARRSGQRSAVSSAGMGALARCIRGEAYAPPDAPDRAELLRQVGIALAVYCPCAGWDDAEEFLRGPIALAMRPGENADSAEPGFNVGLDAAERAFWAAARNGDARTREATRFASTLAAARAWTNPGVPRGVRAAARNTLSRALVVVDKAGTPYVLERGGSYQSGFAPSVLRTHLGASNVLGWAASDGLATLDTSKPYSHFEREHVTTAKEVRPSMVAPRTYFDPSTSTVHEALFADPGRWAPEFSPDVARYLRALAGEREELLLDWLATCADLARPTSAVALHGAPKTGKNLFAALVASIWRGGTAGDGGDPAQFREVCEPFTEGLITSGAPVLHAEEGFPLYGPGGCDITEFFRGFVDGSTFALRAKYRPVRLVAGSPRVVISFNEVRQLREFARHEPDEVSRRALASRILYVPVPDSSARTVAALGGRAAFDAWRASGTFARHVAWLRVTRNVTPGVRMLVEGQGDELIAACCAQAGENGPVLGALARVMLDPSRLAPADRGYLAHRDGTRWVAPRLFAGDAWAAYGGGEARPTMNRIGRAFGLVNRAKRQLGAAREQFHEIDAGALGAHADAAGLDRAAVVAAASAPLPWKEEHVGVS